MLLQSGQVFFFFFCNITFKSNHVEKSTIYLQNCSKECIESLTFNVAMTYLPVRRWTKPSNYQGKSHFCYFIFMFIFGANKAELIEKYVQGQDPGHKILRSLILSLLFQEKKIRLLLFQCQTILKLISFGLGFRLLNSSFPLFSLQKATQGRIECSGRAEGFGMKGQGTEVARLTFTQPLFILDHHRAQMTLKYSINCEPSCACENVWHKRHYSPRMTFCCSYSLSVYTSRFCAAVTHIKSESMFLQKQPSTIHASIRKRSLKIILT